MKQAAGLTTKKQIGEVEAFDKMLRIRVLYGDVTVMTSEGSVPHNNTWKPEPQALSVVERNHRHNQKKNNEIAAGKKINEK